MSNLFYNSYKFIYDDDLGNQSVKVHRSYLNSDGVTEDTPTTQLFIDRVINTNVVVTGSSVGLRHVLSYVGDRRLIAKIPYNPQNQLLVDHVEEILDQPQVLCGDYIGETIIQDGIVNGI